MNDLVKKLRDEPLFRPWDQVSGQAADRIERLEEALRKIEQGEVDWGHKPAQEMQQIAREALRLDSTG